MDTTHVIVAFLAFLVKLPSSGRFEGFCLVVVHYTPWENTLHKKPALSRVGSAYF